MKLISVIILVSLMPNAFAGACQVFGISDSPQKLTCSFKHQEINLHCDKGIYFLNTSRVAQAFHYEVEEGPVPLVFKASDMQLTVIIHSKNRMEAELEKDGKVRSGSCL
jgi:hypothetical protein